MKNASPQTIHLKDYEVPAFLISTLDLRFDLHDTHADVDSRIAFRRNPAGKAGAPFVLDGEKLELRYVKVNGKALAANEYEVTETSLTVHSVPGGEFTFECGTRIKPQENLTLEGLYRSKGMFCTQCEAQGFRKITYYPDRPDVMAVFTTEIEADEARFPVLLSNGNLLEKRSLGNGRLQAKWNDPFPKPAYLFALVAGDFGKTEDHFVTRSGRRVKLEIYVDKGNEDRTVHAMESLKKSMKWDEDTYGLEYDLDIFMIVAVEDFNFGAMENKGLNIFNAGYVLAKATTATDSEYDGIESVVAHEYFHNWTGNRVTCRDWFQLSLKEGLTVYRDQEFSSDVTSRAVCRIDNANGLRNHQFAEDAGPMAHPIRPASYIEINNFYTATVYQKGAEVIRMIATILGKDGFRKGMDKYFELFDGQAVTTEDFVHAMEVANGADLRQFRETWYNQAGTPEVVVRAELDEKAGRYVLDITQRCAPTPGQPVKQPFHIPFALALLDEKGNVTHEKMVHLKKENERVEFPVRGRPVPSFLRDFSAPVNVRFDYSRTDLLFLLAHEKDPFARWEAGQKVALEVLQGMITNHFQGKPLEAPADYLAVFGAIAGDEKIDPAFRAQLLTLPEEGYVAQQQAVIHVDAVHASRKFLQNAIGILHEAKFASLYEKLKADKPYRYHPQDVGERSLKKVLLSYLTATGKAPYRQEALRLLKQATSMTDEIAALSALVHHEGGEREEGLHHFYQKWHRETLVMNKWLVMQGASAVPGGLERIRRIMKDPVFNINNPNNFYSLLLSFGRANLAQFHALDGSSYRFFADLVIDTDSRNPSIAARTVSLFNQWKKFDSGRQALMKAELERIVAHAGISSGVFEIASKALK